MEASLWFASVLNDMHKFDKSTTDRPPISGFRRLRRILLIFVAVPYLSILLLLGIFQRSLLFPATKVDSLPAASVSGYPIHLVRDVAITTTDGVTIRGWQFLAGEPDAASSDQGMSRPLVIVFHGNAGHRAHRVPIALEFVRHDCDVLLMDYRGYGDSEGSPSREGLVQDAVATWQYAVGELGCLPQDIVLFGESLGGAVAVELASHCCQQGDPPGGLLITSTFANLPDTAARTYPMFPVRWIVRDRFSSRDLISSVTCPIVQVHGEVDELVTFDEAEELFAAAPEASSVGIPKRFVRLRETGHNDVPPSELGRALRGMLVDAATR